MSNFIDLNDYTSELEAIQNSNSSVSTMSIDTLSEPYFIIDANAREISVPSQYEYIGVYNDHNAETIYFRINRYFDDVDLSQKTCLIMFVNPKGESSYNVSNSMSVLDDELIIGWTINHEHTAGVGILTFALCFYHIDEDTSMFDYRWSTKPATTKILPGLELIRGRFNDLVPDEFDILIQNMTEHENGFNHPDGSVTAEKLGDDVMQILNG